MITRLDVGSSWMNLDKDPKGNLDKYKTPAEPAGHAVTIVGYTPEDL